MAASAASIISFSVGMGGALHGWRINQELRIKLSPLKIKLFPDAKF
jgi:hypothetical protein